MALTYEEKLRRKEERRKKKYNETHKTINDIEYKVCNRCEEWFPCTEEYFYKVKNDIDGLRPDCKECTKKSAVDYQEKNPERMKIIYRRRDAIKTPIKTERMRNASRKQRIRGDHKKWREENRERVNEYSRKRNLRKKHTISKSEWEQCKFYFNNSCAYCGAHQDSHYRLWGDELKKIDLHKEHVDDTGANDLSNCVPACQSCNSKKWIHSFELWYTKDNNIFSEDRLSKIISWLKEDYKKYIK